MLAALAVSAAGQKDKDKAKDKAKAKLHKTPEECFEAVLTAFDKEDFHLLLRCVTPAVQKRMAGRMAASGLQLREGGPEEIARKYKPAFAVLDKHGLTEKATRDLDRERSGLTKKGRQAAVKLLADPAAFTADFLTAMHKIDPKLGRKDEKKPKLVDVKIDGDKATAKLIEYHRSKPKDKDKGELEERKIAVTFEKINGGWRIDPDPDDTDEDLPKSDKGKDKGPRPKDDKKEEKDKKDK
jgi:hypothetical protein